MANNLTNYGESSLVKHLVGKAAFTMPTTVYVSLHTADPTETGSMAAEVSGGAYSRQAVTWGIESGGSIANSAELAWTVASASWGTVTHIGICDAATAGNMLVFGALTASKTVASGDQFKMAASALSVTLD
jgi:hypothetical protein